MANRKAISSLSQRKLLVLIDLDGVMADFESYFVKCFRQTYPDEPYIPVEKRTTFFLNDQYETLKEDIKPKVRSILETEGFFRDLQPISGACDAVQEMSQMEGVEVFFCSSPLFYYKHSAPEKFHWVETHMGKDWINKVILARDKTMVNGHILIDDKDSIKGAVQQPTWEHVVFTAPYNKHMNLRGRKRLDNWTDGSWRTLIEDFKKKL